MLTNTLPMILLPFSTLTSHGIRSGSLLPELFGEADENSFGTPDVAEPIHVFILDHFANELRAAFAEPRERIVDVLHGEHDAQVAESVHWRAAVIGDDGRREETGDLEPAVTVRRTHHGNLHAHAAQSGNAICPVSCHRGAPLELETKFGEELNGGINVFHHDADVVHAPDRHDVSLASTSAFCSTARAAKQATSAASLRIHTAQALHPGMQPRRSGHDLRREQGESRAADQDCAGYAPRRAA